MPSTVCSTSGCFELVDGGRCDKHQRQKTRAASRRRLAAGDPSMTAYTSPAWREVRRRQLRDEPTCRRCGNDATVVDHTPDRRTLVAQGVSNPDDQAFLQSLCVSCHNRKTATEDGGFGRPKRNDT